MGNHVVSPEQSGLELDVKCYYRGQLNRSFVVRVCVFLVMI